MDYGEVLTKAWRITWKHKILWIFGILASCGRGGGGGGGGSSGWEQSPESGQPFGPDGTAQVERFFEEAGRWLSENLWIVVLLALLVLILMAVFMFLGTIGRIGLVRGTLEADGGAEKLRFGETFRESTPYFWRVFLLGLAVGLVALVIILVLVGCGVLFGVATAGLGALLLLPLLCILVPVFLAVGIVVRQAATAIVIEDLAMMDGLRRGWAVARANLGPMVLIWLMTVVINFAIGLAVAIPLFIAFIPAVIAVASGAEVQSGMLAVAVLCIVLYLPILIVAQGILTAYTESIWALTYLRLTRPGDGRGTPQALPANA